MDWIVLEPRKGKRPDHMARVTMAWRKTSGRSGEALTGCFNVAKAICADLGWPQKGWLELAHSADGTMLRARLSESGYRVSQTNGCASFQAAMQWIRSDVRKAEPVAHKVLPGGVLMITLPGWARMPATVEKRETPPAEPAEPPKKWSDERRALLREMYLARKPTAEIAAALNAMPGPEMKVSDVGAYALSALKLPTRAALDEAAEKAARPAATAAIARPAPPPAKTDDKTEAMKLLEAGMSARAVAEDMGLGLSVVSNWAAEVRARKQGKAA